MTIENDNLNNDEFHRFLYDAFKSAYEVMKNGCPFYIWYASREHINFETAAKEAGLSVRQQLIWNKNSFILGRADYQWKHEPCLYGWKEGAGHYFTDFRNEATVISDEQELNFDRMKKDEMKELLKKIYSTTIQTTIINENKPARDADHPTMKPVQLFGRLIRNSSKAGDIVLDCFGGSGTTIIATEQLARRARVMEYDPHYCDVIIERWERLTGKQARQVQ